MRVILALLVLVALAAAQEYPDSLQVRELGSLTREQNPLRKGFLTVRDGQFRWADGSRAKFWGVNIANRNLWIPRQEIDRVVDAWARAGVNMVRFEATDSKGALLDIPGVPGSRRLNLERLLTLHYWISRVREKKMHYYLDLIDFRTFTPEDGVANAAALPRAARPYACFDERLIELQKEYASQFLTAVNPYTGLAPVDDPMMALVEVCNESGFFLNASHTDKLVEPYRSNLGQRWNAWLLTRYPDRAGLAAAWGTALKPEEDPVAGTVALPHLTGPLDPPPRQQDGVDFFVAVQRDYFKTMKGHLRRIGVKVPITAVVSADIPPDVYSVAAEMDFVSENHYVDHPAFSGPDWQGKFFYQNTNTLRDPGRFGFAPYTATLRWPDKPVVIREWGWVWPNTYRAASMPEALAYACLQDYDGMLLFSYKTGEVAPRLVEFGYQSDPCVWGLFSAAGLAFLRQDVEVGEDLAELIYPVGPESARVAYALRTLTRLEPSGDTEVVLTAGGKSPEAALGPLFAAGTYTSSTGQIERRTSQGLLRIQAPRLVALAGELPDTAQVGPLEYAGTSPVGAVLAISLDDEPLESSQRFLIKFVSVAENTGQSLIPVQGGPAPLMLEHNGTAPVLTRGAPSPTPTRVNWNGRPLLSLFQMNGCFELMIEDGRAVFWTDTPQVRFQMGETELVSNGSVYDLPLTRARQPVQNGAP
ncbi:MAG: hypothetical protein AMXMBFR33_14190 [Candidatus Xenobia bacterium]